MFSILGRLSLCFWKIHQSSICNRLSNRSSAMTVRISSCKRNLKNCARSYNDKFHVNAYFLNYKINLRYEPPVKYISPEGVIILLKKQGRSCFDLKITDFQPLLPEALSISSSFSYFEEGIKKWRFLCAQSGSK